MCCGIVHKAAAQLSKLLNVPQCIARHELRAVYHIAGNLPCLHVLACFCMHLHNSQFDHKHDDQVMCLCVRARLDRTTAYLPLMWLKFLAALALSLICRRTGSKSQHQLAKFLFPLDNIAFCSQPTCCTLSFVKRDYKAVRAACKRQINTLIQQQACLRESHNVAHASWRSKLAHVL